MIFKDKELCYCYVIPSIDDVFAILRTRTKYLPIINPYFKNVINWLSMLFS